MVHAISQGSTEAGGAAQSSSAPPALRAHIDTALAHAFASATQAVLYGMAVALGITFLLAIRHPGARPKAPEQATSA